jgi:hypothetical protein
VCSRQQLAVHAVAVKRSGARWYQATRQRSVSYTCSWMVPNVQSAMWSQGPVPWRPKEIGAGLDRSTAPLGRSRSLSREASASRITRPQRSAKGSRPSRRWARCCSTVSPRMPRPSFPYRSRTPRWARHDRRIRARCGSRDCRSTGNPYEAVIGGDGAIDQQNGRRIVPVLSLKPLP